MASAGRVAVIGGGIGGLAAARALVRSPAAPEVVVYEAGPHVGGVLATSRSDGYLLDHAANAIVSGAPDGALALCDALGVEVVRATPAAKRRWIFIDDTLKEVPTSAKAFARSDLLSTRAKLRLLAEPLIAEQAADGDESIYEFAARRLGEDVARAIVAPFVTGLFAGDARRMSLQAGFPELATLRASGGIVRGLLARSLARRKEPAAPAKDELRARGGIFAPWEGTAALPLALAAELGERVRCSAAVERIVHRDRLLTVQTSGGQAEAYDAVVLATPGPVSAGLLGGGGARPESATARAAQELAQIPYVSAVVVHLGFERAAVPHPLDGFGFLVAAGERLRVLEVVFESVLWANRAPRDRVLLRCTFGGARDPGAAALSEGALIDQARRDLDRTLGIRKAPTFARVTRWPQAIPQYEVGHASRIDRAEAALGPRGVFLAGAAARGVAVTSIVSDARRVAALVGAWLAGGRSPGAA